MFFQACPNSVSEKYPIIIRRLNIFLDRFSDDKILASPVQIESRRQIQCSMKKNKFVSQWVENVNLLLDMPILGFSIAAANKDMMSKKFDK